MELIECLSSSSYAERPVAFLWEGRRLEIASILSRWQTPERRCFRVQTGDRRTFDLAYLEAENRWQIQPTPGG